MNTCPWCGTPSNKTYLSVKDHFLSQECFDILECEHCGLLFTHPRPDPSVIGNYYKSDEYYSHQQNKKGFIPRLYELVKKPNMNHKVRLALGKRTSGRLLDIGCGVGDFLVAVQQRGFEVVGIEPSADARAIATTRLGFEPLAPDALATLPEASFDVITLWHVLEHIDDLKQEIAALSRLLKPDGSLIIALPNFKSFDASYYQEAWAAWDVPRHLNHFSPASIHTIFGETDLKLLDTQKLIWDAYYISYLSEKYLGHRLPLVRGFVTGLRSNGKARRTGMYSSLVYRFCK